ncbi:hypothetical protein B296_00019505 [Ensete ventricosum]|uniref:Uncharacterized protein n=1 Tax=Ensete ventricosum TaxID=4639 RepID=A0A426YW11_ENSVE|nr:hypothetical protein B296_00019505 [Ensete ventricosum]
MGNSMCGSVIFNSHSGLGVSSGQQRRKQGEESEEKQQPRRKQLVIVWGLQQLLRRSQHGWAVAVRTVAEERRRRAAVVPSTNGGWKITMEIKGKKRATTQLALVGGSRGDQAVEDLYQCSLLARDVGSKEGRDSDDGEEWQATEASEEMLAIEVASMVVVTGGMGLLQLLK